MQYYGKRQPQGEMKLSRRSLARMEAFVASCALALPDDLILPFVPSSRRIANGGKLNNNTSKKKPPPIFAGLQTFATSLRGTAEQKSNNVDTATSIRNDDKYPQMNVNDLTLRLELYIRNLRRIYAVREQQLQQQQEEQIRQGNHKELIECVVNFEPPRTIRARIQILLNSLIATTNSVGSMRPILTNLLKNLTRELLAVECLSEELNGYIRKIVLEYEHLTSFASLAFLSSPGDSAETHLSPLLLNYLEYLRTEWELCVDKCKLESTLARAIHPGMRKVFKSSEFTSIGHLLEVCQGYKDQLENVVILPRDSINWGDGSVIDSSVDGSLSPPDVISSAASGDTPDLKKISSSTTKAIKQALRDLRREIITVNGHLLPPAQSLTELVKLLRERLHSRTVKLKDRKIAQVKKRQGNDSSDSNSPSTSDSGTSYNTDNDIVSSGNEGDTDGSTPRNCRSNNKNSPENSFFDSDQKQEGIAGKVKRRHFNVDAIDIMTRRLLVAASRTSSGGDAFFVV
jgi:chorismate mutase